MRIRAKIGELTVERLHVTQAPEPKAEIKAALRTQDRRQIRRRCAGGCEVAERTGVERRWRSIDVELDEAAPDVEFERGVQSGPGLFASGPTTPTSVGGPGPLGSLGKRSSTRSANWTVDWRGV